MQELLGFQRFGVHSLEGRYAIVPFEERGSWSEARNGMFVQLPDRINHRVIVGIQNIFFELGMTRNVNLGHAFGGTLSTYS